MKHVCVLRLDRALRLHFAIARSTNRVPGASAEAAEIQPQRHLVQESTFELGTRRCVLSCQQPLAEQKAVRCVLAQPWEHRVVASLSCRAALCCVGTIFTKLPSMRGVSVRSFAGSCHGRLVRVRFDLFHSHVQHRERGRSATMFWVLFSDAGPALITACAYLVPLLLWFAFHDDTLTVSVTVGF